MDLSRVPFRICLVCSSNSFFSFKVGFSLPNRQERKAEVRETEDGGEPMVPTPRRPETRLPRERRDRQPRVSRPGPAVKI